MWKALCLSHLDLLPLLHSCHPSVRENAFFLLSCDSDRITHMLPSRCLFTGRQTAHAQPLFPAHVVIWRSLFFHVFGMHAAHTCTIKLYPPSLCSNSTLGNSCGGNMKSSVSSVLASRSVSWAQSRSLTSQHICQVSGCLPGSVCWHWFVSIMPDYRMGDR